MTPQEFIAKWRSVELKERSASQSHFNDLCRLLDLPDPISADPKGDWFAFEQGASKAGVAKAGPMSGARIALAGNTRASARI